ncbi:MAG: hypothetical protein RI928_140 [Pseudomonadota bacterium]|jgi:uncharacterized membrane protein YqjE
MLKALQKSKQLSVIAIDRLGDYLALLQIEMKLQGRELGAQLAGYMLAAVCAFFMLLFTGIAIVMTFWDSDYRHIAAWLVVGLYAAAAGAGISLARQHAGRSEGMMTLRDEIKRDVALVRESL